MMSLLAQFMQQQSGGSNPPQETLVCTISGAGTSACNGEYYTDSSNPLSTTNAIAKHATENLWIRIQQIHMGSPFFNYYSYVIADNPNSGGTTYYEWFCTNSLNASVGQIHAIGSGSGSNTVCTRASGITCVVFHGGTPAVNGVYLTSEIGGGVFAKHAFSNIYLVGVLGPPDYYVLAPNTSGESAYYSWSSSDSIPLISDIENGASPEAYIYN